MNLEEAQLLLNAGPMGVEEWNRRRAHGEPIPDLREVDLSGKELSGIDFSGLRIIESWFWGATLVGADFRRTIFQSTYFESVNAHGACFIEADLRNSRFGILSLGLGHSCSAADVSEADFTRAYLVNADLSETIVRDARFCEADLTNADLRYSDFSTADLTNAKLDGVIWTDPTTDSAGKIPKVHFGDWLRELRELRGMAPDELAFRIGNGLSGCDVTEFLEQKSDGVGPHLAHLLSEAFQIAVSDVPRCQSGN